MTTLVIVVAISALLLMSGEAFEIVSVGATVAAVAGGAVVGAGLSQLARTAGFATYSDRRQIAAVLVFFAVAMGGSLLVPVEHTPTLLQFCLIAIWSTALAELTRTYVGD